MQVHGAAGEGKGLQMDGRSGKGELGPASSCVLLWVHPCCGNSPLSLLQGPLRELVGAFGRAACVQPIIVKHSSME